MTTRVRAELSQPRLSQLDSFLTPNHLYYVRDHFVDRPELSVKDWSLRVSGLGEARTFSMEDIVNLPSKTVTVTMECAGNGGHGRGYDRFQHDMTCMVSTAEWIGTPVSSFFPEGVPLDVSELVFRGSDGGVDPDEPVQIDSYTRSIPRQKVLHQDTILAYEMNGAPLPIAHGFPLRLVVPGWYGMDSVKWIESIEAFSSKFKHFYIDHRYRTHSTDAGLHTGRPVREMAVKSIITSPSDGERLLRKELAIKGLAWAGEHEVTKVEVSFDGGSTWIASRLGEDNRQYSWRAWSLVHQPDSSGPLDVVVRAQDSKGRTQPMDDRPIRTYEANWVRRIRLFIVDGLQG